MQLDSTISGTLFDPVNAFRIVLPKETTLRYRIWSVDPLPGTPAMREKIRSFLWQRQLHRPVMPTYLEDRFSFAVADWGRQAPITYDAGERQFLITATDVQRSIELDALDLAAPAEASLAAAMLQQTLNLHLRGNPSLAPGFKNGQYFELLSDEPYHPHRRPPTPRQAVVDIFRGFNFRVIHLRDIGLCLTLDIVSSYVGRSTLSDYWQRNQRLDDIDSFGGIARWMYDCGRTRQSVYVLGRDGRTIGKATLSFGGTTYDYLCRKYPEIADRISPTDLAATMIYSLRDRQVEGKHYTAASTLLRPKLTTQHRDVRSLGDTPAFPPFERQQRIEQMRRYCEGARFAGQPLAFEPMARLPRAVFSLPGVQFGPAGQPVGIEPLRVAENQVAARQNWGGQKLASLRQHGPYRPSVFMNPCFAYPESFEDESLFSEFLKLTQENCQSFGHVPFSPRYEPYRDTASPREIVRKIRSLVAAPQNAGFILLALPADPFKAQQVYAGVKSSLTVPTKCFAITKLRSQANRARHRAYIERNTLAMLVENNVRPWGLAEPLRYELHFGIDVTRLKQGGLLGMAAVSGVGACDIVFRHKLITRRELIPENVIQKFISARLRDFVEQNGRTPHSIMFQRDGRIWDEEYRGITAALGQFTRKHRLQSPPRWVAVSIEKTTSAPVRLFRDDGGPIGGAFSGAYLVQDDRTGYLVTAGAPTLPQGTPSPLQIEVVEGTDHIVPVMEDIFRLAQLNWNSPETDTKLPITLRFTDQMLERYAIEQDSDDDDDDEDEADEA